VPVIDVVTRIRATPEICFDLARDIDLHAESMQHTGERAVGGVTKGLIGAHEEVTWEAKHFGVRQRLTSRITVFDRPRHFRDSQVAGAFQRFDHDHFFETDAGVTVMRDLFDYDSPLGFLGRIADRMFLHSYMTRLIEGRAGAIRKRAESTGH
jgi:ligand-binding SRPBCC domain-containing protein